MAGHNGSGQSVEFNNNGNFALSGGEDRTLKYWRLSDGACIRTFTGHNGTVNKVVLSKDNQFALSASYDGSLKYWRVSDATCLKTFTGHSGGAYTVAFVNDLYIISGGADKELRLWRISDGACVMEYKGHGYSIYALSVSPDGNYVLSGTWDRTLRYWRISDGTCLKTISVPDGVGSVEMSPVEETGFKDAASNPLPSSILKAYPNPFCEILNLELGAKASIYSITGRLIKQVEKGSCSIDTRKWQSGVYLVSINDGSISRRIVKINR